MNEHWPNNVETTAVEYDDLSIAYFDSRMK